MKKLILKFSVFVFLLMIATPSEAVKVKPVDKDKAAVNSESITDENTTASTAITKQSKKELRKERKMQKRFKKLKKKLSKWQKKSAKEYFGGATDNDKFRLGFLAFLAGLGFVILVNILGLGWLLGGLGGLVAFIGICLMIWGVLEYS